MAANMDHTAHAATDIVPIRCDAELPLDRLIEASPYILSIDGIRDTGERLDYLSADGCFAAGVADYESVTLEIGDWPVDELMVVIEGAIEVGDSAGNSHRYGPGEAFIMPRGFSGTWRTHGRTRKIAVSYNPSGG